MKKNKFNVKVEEEFHLMVVCHSGRSDDVYDLLSETLSECEKREYIKVVRDLLGKREISKMIKEYKK